MKFTIGVKILLGFGLALLILIVVEAVSYRSTVALIDNADWVAHTYRVIGKVESLIAETNNAEAGRDGYLLTGRETYLEPYQQAKRTVDSTLGEVRSLTADNPHQQQRLDQLTPLLANRLALLQETIDVRREKGADTAMQLVLNDQGKNMMGEIRKIIDQMEGEETDLLKQRTDEAKASAQATTSTILYGTLVASMLVGLVGVLIQRS
ncbi:MAG TPA: CHASE3 domain-containing protein, partial [Pirellulales bacterium]|nr:CHASE3 domain-containing protein [Pirellulales bacterium]